MGALCEKEEMPIESKRCFKCEKKSETLHVFPECLHQICNACLPRSSQQPLVCPISHNMGINIGRQIYNSVRKFNQDSQMCSKKHKMIWRDEFNMCGTCKIYLHGYKCRVCNEIKCTLCSKAFDAKKQKCPNKHSIMWRSVQIPCLLCGLKKHGWSCKDCRWYACSQCCDTRYNVSGCPNLHSLIWKSSKQPCTICKTKSVSCFNCETCVANFCLRCTDYKFDKNLCPNKHKTQLVTKNVCVKCELQMPGMGCNECNYHFCSKCDLQKYATNTRNRQDAYASIRIVIQNPLLQFEQFEQKSSINLMKQAAQKLKKKPVLQIRVEDSSQQSGINASSNPIQSLKKQIESNPKNINFYIKLAETYKQMQSYIEEIDTYCKLLEVQGSKPKQERNQSLLFKIGCKALERTFEMKYVKSSIIILEKLIELAIASENSEINNNLKKWRIQRIQQIILSRQITFAEQEFAKIETGGQDYERVKKMLEQEAI